MMNKSGQGGIADTLTRECWISVRSVIDGRIKPRPNTTYNKLVHNTLLE